MPPKSKGIVKKTDQAMGSSLKAKNNKKKQVFKALLDNPFTSNNWPFIQPKDSEDILTVFKVLIKPHFNQVNAEDKPKIFKSPHEGVYFGFNSIVETLERQASNFRGKKKDSIEPLKYLLVCKNELPSVMTDLLPTLCFTASKDQNDKVKLIQLPKGSMEVLSNCIGKPRCGIIALNKREEFESLNILMDKVDDITIPWLNDIFNSPTQFYAPKISTNKPNVV
ncbi:POP3 [Candida pseudojiufengensis]|uniref:POP3 n=1 Tax=Candida pseudojiufengensis TaxID=497109 RepID=UPI0022253FAD|nr:POP3 [Candida pseudojiufengensis]KAI5961814.1 POP3 [Candida pseudojiufengensis]